MKRAKNVWLLEVTTTIQLKSRPDFLDVRLPPMPLPRLSLMGLVPGYPVPAAMPWLNQPLESGNDVLEALPISVTCDDDTVKLGLPNSQRNCPHHAGTRFAANGIKLVAKYRVPEASNRISAVDLIRPTNVIDRGAKAWIMMPEQL